MPAGLLLLDLLRVDEKLVPVVLNLDGAPCLYSVGGGPQGFCSSLNDVLAGLLLFDLLTKRDGSEF